MNMEYSTLANRLLCRFDVNIDQAASVAAGRVLEDRIAEFSQRKNPPDGNELPLPLKIVFDLSNVEFVDSAFLRVCQTMTQALQPDAFSVINVQPALKRLFRNAGLADVVKTA